MLGVLVWFVFCALIAVGTLAVFVKFVEDIVMAVRNPQAGWAAFKRWAIGDLVKWRGKTGRRRAKPSAAPDPARDRETD